jgi:hypothetical protein
MSEVTFQLAYDGESVRNGSMDVADLAPALLAVGELITEANRILNEDRASVAVRVESDFKKSSFEISLIVDQGVIDQAKAILTGHGITNADALLHILFGGTSVAAITGLIKIFKALKGEKPKEITIINNNNNTTIIETASGNMLSGVDRSSAALYGDDSVRETLGKVVKPLDRPGIDTLVIRKNKEVLERVSKDEAPYFHPQPIPDRADDPPVVDDTRVRVLEIVRLAFRKGIKSRFSDGTVEFEADVTDDVFLKQIERGESFAKGDALRVYLRQKTWRDRDGKLRSEYEVAEVVEHLKRPTQLRFQ